MRGMRFVMAAVLATGMAPGMAQETDAQVTVLTAATIRTMDPARPVAGALAFDAGGEILAVGDPAELLARWPDAARLDFGDATVVPGLIDAHGHVAGLGQARMRVELEGTRDKAEVLARLRAFAATLAPGEWLLGRGWDQNDWPDQAFPTAADLDAAFPDRPVWLERIDGHAGWANSAALQATGQDLDADPAGVQPLLIVASQLSPAPALALDAAAERLLKQTREFEAARRAARPACSWTVRWRWSMPCCRRWTSPPPSARWRAGCRKPSATA